MHTNRNGATRVECYVRPNSAAGYVYNAELSFTDPKPRGPRPSAARPPQVPPSTFGCLTSSANCLYYYSHQLDAFCTRSANAGADDVSIRFNATPNGAFCPTHIAANAGPSDVLPILAVSVADAAGAVNPIYLYIYIYI